MKSKIRLTGKDGHCKFALVDEDNWRRVMAFNTRWHYHYGYAATTYKDAEGKRKNMRMHRYIMNAKEGQEVDYINGNRLGNRKANLRLLDGKGEGSSIQKRNRGTWGSSKFPGVSWVRTHKRREVNS